MKKLYPFVVILFSVMIFIGFTKEKKKGVDSVKSAFSVDYKYISANQILMWVGNNGDGSHDPRTDGAGYYWPGGESAKNPAIFEDGLVWGGLIDSMPRVNGSTYRHGTLPGRILEDGTADDPNAERNRIFKIRKDWENLPEGEEKRQYEKDYYEWPGDRGAPYVDVNGDGKFTRGIDKPDFVGDEVLWWVMNDLDTAASRFTYGADPIGLEIQVTVWAFTKAHLLGDVVFKKYKLINKGSNTVKDMYLGYFSDVDLGSAVDDYAGCDTSLSLGFVFNGEEYDDVYGFDVPAVGYQFLETPVVQSSLSDSALIDGKYKKGYVNLPMTAFVIYLGGSSYYRDPSKGVIEGSYNLYNNFKGKAWDGSSYIDPFTGNTTTFVLAGDPVNRTGWYEGSAWWYGSVLQPSDRRILQSTGPFDFAPGDTQNVVIAIPIAFQEDYLQSVAFLKDRCRRLKKLYSNNFQISTEQPKAFTATEGNNAVIYWQDNAEDKIYPNLNSAENNIDSLYRFEGYRIYQFSDEEGNNPLPIMTIDKNDNISSLYDLHIVGDYLGIESVLELNNDGIRRYFNIDKDYFNDTKLYPAKKYYFGLTSIFTSNDLRLSNEYGSYMVPSYIESKPIIREIIPSRNSIDQNYSLRINDNLFAEHISGYGDGYVNIKIIDPSRLAGKKYKIVFHENADTLAYSLIYEESNDTLISHSNAIPRMKVSWYLGNMTIDFNWRDSLSAPIIDGFQFWIRDLGNDSTSMVPTNYRVKDVLEIISPDENRSVWNSPSRSGKWQITAKGPNNRLNWQSLRRDVIGYKDYEVRFTGESEYYVSGYRFGFPYSILFQNDSLGMGTVPFEIWDIGRTPDDPSDDKRLAIKILDNSNWDSTLSVPDRKWSRLPNGDWEEIYAFEPKGWSADTLVYPDTSGRTVYENHKFGALVIRGELPEPGTIIRITTWKPLSSEDVFVINIPASKFDDKQYAKENIDKITVFPNPFYGIKAEAENSINVKFTNLPKEVRIRIYSLSGHLVRKLYKNEMNPFLTWDLRNESGLQIANGIYIAHLEMPGIGEKIMKIAVVF